MSKSNKSMHLRNKNGINYVVLNQRNSLCYKGHKDYIVRNPNGGGVYLVHGWKPKQRQWEHSSFYGWDKKALNLARKDFKSGKC